MNLSSLIKYDGLSHTVLATVLGLSRFCNLWAMQHRQLRRRRAANSFFPNDIAVAPPTMSVIRIRACVTTRSCIRRSQAPYKCIQETPSKYSNKFISRPKIMRHLNVVNKKVMNVTLRVYCVLMNATFTFPWSIWSDG